MAKRTATVVMEAPDKHIDAAIKMLSDVIDPLSQGIADTSFTIEITGQESSDKDAKPPRKSNARSRSGKAKKKE